ncbi:MAG: arabinosyltransferase domain-containing protein [Gaiella sp.]|nr:arabinosyltransferase domain-containing protein [Gaiella sp.]
MRSGTLTSGPTVFGLITELDLHAGAPLSVRVRPIAQDTRPSAGQTALRIVGAIFLAIAVIVLLWPLMRPRAWPRRRRIGLSTQDLFVGVTLGAWWLLAPLHFDDGWVRARQVNSLVSGGFSNFYEPWGANLPMATWFEWLQHFVVGRSDALALHRLATILVVAATWGACRACLTKLVGRGPTRADAAWWTAAMAFSLGAAAFGITLRPEPAISLLAVAVLGCSLDYLERPRLWPIALSTFLCGLAVTIHPSGAVAFAPLAICVPQMIRDARRRIAFDVLELASVVPIGLAWMVLLAFLDSDFTTHRVSLALLRDTEEHGAGILQELDRYASLSFIGASPLRRLVVGWILLAGLLAVATAFSRRNLAQRLPTASVLVGLVTLVFAPSKWIWHFGALIGLSVVALGFETYRLGTLKLVSVARWSVVAGGLIAVLWAVRYPGIWGPIDTERLAVLYSTRPYVAATVLAFGGLLVASGLRWVSRPQLVVLPVLTAALLSMTTLLFAIDAATPGEWTAARQVLSSFGGRDGCGVASDLVVSVPGALRSGAALDSRSVRAIASHRGDVTPAVSPIPGWYPVPKESVGVFTQGLRRVNRLRVTWGRRTSSGIKHLRSGKAQIGQANWGYARWQFLAEDSLPRRPRDANMIRFDATGTKGLRGTAVITRPVPYTPSRLSAILDRPRAVSFVAPFLFEATPCAKLPRLAYGVAEPPDVIVDFNPGGKPRPTSLYAGIGDVFDLVRVPLEESAALKYIAVYWVRPEAGEAVALPEQTVLSA